MTLHWTLAAMGYGPTPVSEIAVFLERSLDELGYDSAVYTARAHMDAYSGRFDEGLGGERSMATSAQALSGARIAALRGRSEHAHGDHRAARR